MAVQAAPCWQQSRGPQPGIYTWCSWRCRHAKVPAGTCWVGSLGMDLRGLGRAISRFNSSQSGWLWRGPSVCYSFLCKSEKKNKLKSKCSKCTQCPEMLLLFLDGPLFLYQALLKTHGTAHFITFSPARAHKRLYRRACTVRMWNVSISESI